MKAWILLAVTVLGGLNSIACVTLNKDTKYVRLTNYESSWMCSTSRDIDTRTIVMPMTLEVLNELSRYQGEAECIIESQNMIDMSQTAKSNVPGLKVSTSQKIAQIFKVSGCRQGN